jgi:RHS repeat-associated protein
VTSYAYYDNSNLWVRQDASGKYSVLSYDALNRVTQKTYSDNTPAVSYTYAGASHTQDFLASISAGYTTESYSGYDALGRPGAITQTTNGAPYSFTSIQWTPQGQMKSVTYPSGRTVTTGFDGAGRPNSVTGLLNGNPTYYATSGGVSYAAHGGLSQLNTGDGVSRAVGYNSRLQMSGLSASSGAGNLLSLGYSYGTSSTANNGNVSIEDIGRPGWNVEQSFGYDAANRLYYAHESTGWTQNYVFDAMGNRAVSTNAYIPSPAYTPQTFDSSVPYDAHNHWTGAAYDPSGVGTLKSVGTQSMTYDAENRLTSLNDTGLGIYTTFTYDGAGRRVTKTSNNVTATYVYGPDGELAVQAGGAAPAVSGTIYVTQDRIGSTRLVTDRGGVVGCHDYLPFGEEIPAGTTGWGRTSISCYGTSGDTDVKYTGQLFDSETGLAYFNARYLRESMGAFISADEPMNDQWGSEAQSWKLDAYARNNPLRFADPSGMCSEQESGGFTDADTGAIFYFYGPCGDGVIGDMNDTGGNSVTVTATAPPDFIWSDSGAILNDGVTGSGGGGGGGGGASASTNATTTGPKKGCPAVPAAPPGVSVNGNMKQARKNALWNPLWILWFKNQVQYGGPWDYKTRGAQYENFGNFNYGATGTAAFAPSFTLLRAAGWAQRHHPSSPQFGGDPGSLPGIFLNPFGGTAPYGDDPHDQETIRQGIRYARNGCGG